jgi:predicted XRE-type DNA-binding protein
MGEKLKIVRGSGNVFLDIGFSPGEAQNLQLRSELMNKIEHSLPSGGLTQKERAVHMGVTQPRVYELLKGKVDKFRLDALVNMLGHAGIRVQLLVKKTA